MNYINIRPLLEEVEWDFHGGPPAPYGDWAVETREEFAHVAAARLPIVREACASGKYNAIVLLGGGEPGFMEAREIARKFGMPVTSCAFSQMHIATMLGNKFSVIDFTEVHDMFYYDLVVRHRFTDRCASIRNIHFYHSRPGIEQRESTIDQERDRALRGEPSEAVERAFKEAVAAIEEDGAEVITFGCRERAAVLAGGSIVTFPSITWLSHTTIGTGAWCGHHDVVNPTYYLREKRETVSPQGQQVRTEGFANGGVESLAEAFHRARPGCMTAAIHAPFGRSRATPCWRAATLASARGSRR